MSTKCFVCLHICAVVFNLSIDMYFVLHFFIHCFTFDVFVCVCVLCEGRSDTLAARRCEGSRGGGSVLAGTEYEGRGGESVSHRIRAAKFPLIAAD
jgi:hypothetical protein